MIDLMDEIVRTIAPWFTVGIWTFKLGKFAVRLITEMIQTKRQTKKRNLK